MIRIAGYVGIALVVLTVSAVAAPPAGERDWTVELKFGAYQPRIDTQFQRSENSTTPPYEEAFGTESSLSIQTGAERIVYGGFGTLSVGASIGYWSIEGSAVPADESGLGDAEDTTEFVVFPFQFQTSYRFDKFAEYVPLVPVVRAGLSYYYWRVLNGSGDVAEFAAGKEAEGGTLGWHATIGAHLLLDFLDDEMALDFERDAGVYNSYLTIEYRYSRIDDFGAANSFRMGDETVLIGLALDL